MLLQRWINHLKPQQGSNLAKRVTQRTLEEDLNYESMWSRITPMGHPASVADIANAALFLVSENARHITGQSLVVDGAGHQLVHHQIKYFLEKCNDLLK